MTNQELVQWIRTEEGKGHSRKELTSMLLQQKHSMQDITDAFNSIHAQPFLVSFTLLCGVGIISLLVVMFIIAIVTFSYNTTVGYILLPIVGTVVGYFMYHLKKNLHATERFGALLGIFAPTLPILFILLSLEVLQQLSAQLAEFSAIGGGGFSGLLTIFGPSIMNPFLAAGLFYLFCNLFMIISVFKEQEYKTYLWYLLAPTLFIIVWLLVDVFVGGILHSAGL